MKKTFFVLFILTFGFTSCNFLGQIDINIQTKNVEVSSKELVGIWKMDEFSYKYLTDLKKDSIIISFKTDSTFEINNSHSLFKKKIDNKRNIGTWKIIEESLTKKVRLTFNKVNHTKDLNIYKKDKDYQLWHFLSDPDSGERIRFIK